MNSDRDRNQILLKTPVIFPYYLLLVMELRNVLFINFVCYFTEFKVREFKFVFINNCLSTLTANTQRNNICYHTSADCQNQKVSRSLYHLFHLVLYNNLLPLIFTFMFSASIQKFFFKFHFTDLRQDS